MRMSHSPSWLPLYGDARVGGVSAPTSRRTDRSRLRRRPYVLLVGLAGLALVTDQVTKALVTTTLAGGRVVPLFDGWLYLDYTRNSGAAFSFFQGGAWVLALIALAVSGGILLFYRRVVGSPLTVRAGLALVLGGALGNLVDRVRLGYVVDFIDLRWWPAFNLADSAISLGVGLLILASLRGWGHDLDG